MRNGVAPLEATWIVGSPDAESTLPSLHFAAFAAAKRHTMEL